ncbi:hypothetical protein HN587_00935 [Candidatus Woesearchaeota archaeon]|jgi:hypothetical protein|nr:hypothetical protein [Candidatus Woesearchaeota archaeon]
MELNENMINEFYGCYFGDKWAKPESATSKKVLFTRTYDSGIRISVMFPKSLNGDEEYTVLLAVNPKEQETTQDIIDVFNELGVRADQVLFEKGDLTSVNGWARYVSCKSVYHYKDLETVGEQVRQMELLYGDAPSQIQREFNAHGRELLDIERLYAQTLEKYGFSARFEKETPKAKSLPKNLPSKRSSEIAPTCFIEHPELMPKIYFTYCSFSGVFDIAMDPFFKEFKNCIRGEGPISSQPLDELAELLIMQSSSLVQANDLVELLSLKQGGREDFWVDRSDTRAEGPRDLMVVETKFLKPLEEYLNGLV